MKIHIFALRWRDEIRRSSQLRTLLKRVVVNRTWKKIQARTGFEPMTSAIPALPMELTSQLGAGQWIGYKWTSKCFGLFAVTVGSSQRYCNGKRFSPSLQRVTLIFTWFYSTKRFRLFPARLRCFQQYVYENRLFLSSLPKLRFWPFILPKPSFGLVATKLEASSFMSQKAAI